MNKNFLLTIAFLMLIAASCTKPDIELKSPSAKLKAKINSDEPGLNLSLFDKNQSIVSIDLASFVFNDDDTITFDQISNISQSSEDETWQPVYGERDTIRNRYNELKLTLTAKDHPDKSLQLICRLYDEGMAFRYLFDEKSTDGLVLKKELTSFNFEGDYDAWITDRAQGVYKKEPISEIDRAIKRPLVIERSDSSFFALGEAALVDYARMKFTKNPEKPFSLQIALDGDVDLEKANFATPWRYVMVANSAGDLLENNFFILNLNEPNKLEDISWIEPGKVIREVTLTTQGGMACVDFAAKHNLQYVEFDAGWYGPENDVSSDASSITVDPKRSPGPLDLHGVIDYANEKGIGIILYVNRRALEKQLDEILPLYQSWGIKGLKYGFVNVGPQEWTAWLHDAVRKSADHQLMVDVHDEYRPTGYSRTYPNLMTQEGIRGDEESPSPEHTLTSLFTRMIAGAGDNTNCYLAPRVSEKLGGKAAQMAKAVMLYSPWQFVYWYDRPEGSPHKKGGAGASESIIMDNDDLGFYDALPTVWDETKVLEGKIGKYATIARKNGDAWFIGSMTSGKGRKVEIPLTFLDQDKNYEAVIYFQDEEDLQDNRVSIETMDVNRETVLTKELVENSGFALILKKI